MEKSALKEHCKDGFDFVEKRNWAPFFNQRQKVQLDINYFVGETYKSPKYELHFLMFMALITYK